jgi:hypothetical protein
MHWSWKNCHVAWHGHSVGTRRIPLSSLKPWQITRLDLACILWNAWVVMTSILFNGKRTWLHCVKGHKYSLKQMVTSITMAIILPTTSTQGGKHLWSRWSNPKVRNKPDFIMHKWWLERMWREHLKFCEPKLLSWEDWLDFRTKTRLSLVHHERLYHHA